MHIKKGLMIALGYGKYFRSDNIIGLEPVEEQRGPGHRTRVYIEGLHTPLVVARSEQAILHDLVEIPATSPPDDQERYSVLNELLSLLDGVERLKSLLGVEEEDPGWRYNSNLNCQEHENIN
jgi:hypothetical protein